MSKRKKSQRRPNLPAATRVGRRAPAAASTSTAAPAPTATRRETFAPDYGYVKKDLRRIGVLAGSFIGILVILSFFIR